MEYSRYEIQALANLGLNAVEISIYLALSKSEKASVATISKILNINKLDTYKSIIHLYDLGLVEEVADNSAQVRAVSTQQMMNVLHEKAADIPSKLAINIESLMASIKIAKEYRITDSKFVLIPKKDTLLKKVLKTTVECRENVDFIVSWKRFNNVRLSIPDDFRIPARCRCILEQPLRLEDLEIVRRIKGAGCEIRFIPTHPDVALGIFDMKEMVIVENFEENNKNTSSLWTDNKSIITIAKIYFENLWLTSTEKPLIAN